MVIRSAMEKQSESRTFLKILPFFLVLMDYPVILQLK